MSLDFGDHGAKYYTKDGCPLQCIHCESTDIRERVVDFVDVYNGMGPPCEIEYTCGGCQQRVGYWAHGNYFDPSHI